MSMSYSDMSALAGMYESAGALQAKKIGNDYKLGKEEIAARLKIAGMQSKDTRYGIEMERQTAIENLALAREEMERIGIPEMEIKRYVAEKTYEIAQAEMDVKRQALSGWIPGAEGQPDTATLEREELTRRYGFDVAQFGAQLGSTPDTYFQARRFQGADVPRLLGGSALLQGSGTQMAHPTAGPAGAPTPGVATMGSYLSGQDPYASPYGGQAPNYAAATPGGAPAPAAPGTLGMSGTPEDDRAKQIAGIAKVAPPSPYDGLNEQDTATLKLMESIYKQGGGQVAGGELERLKASGRYGFLASAGRLLGYSPEEFEATYQAYRPAQGSASAAG